MSKGLEALETLKFLVDNYSHFEFDFTIIEKELKEKEQIGIMYSNCVIEGAKQKKALEVIKVKGLSINDIAFIKNGESWETYVETMKQLYWGDEHLDKVLKTKQEYELLKEVLL